MGGGRGGRERGEKKGNKSGKQRRKKEARGIYFTREILLQKKSSRNDDAKTQPCMLQLIRIYVYRVNEFTGTTVRLFSLFGVRYVCYCNRPSISRVPPLPPESMLFQRRVCVCTRPPDETSFSLYSHVFLPRLFQECVYQKNPIPCFYPRICLTRKCRRQLKYSVGIC